MWAQGTADLASAISQVSAAAADLPRQGESGGRRWGFSWSPQNLLEAGLLCKLDLNLLRVRGC